MALGILGSVWHSPARKKCGFEARELVASQLSGILRVSLVIPSGTLSQVDGTVVPEAPLDLTLLSPPPGRRQDELCPQSGHPSNTGSGTSGGCGVMGRACPQPPSLGAGSSKEQNGLEGGAGLPRLDSPPYPKKSFERFSWQSLKLPFIQLAGTRPG